MNGRLYGNLRPGFYLLNVSCGKGLGNTREKVRFLLKLISPYMKVRIKSIILNIKFTDTDVKLKCLGLRTWKHGREN